MAVTTPIKLQMNKRYPSYQLYAVAGTQRSDPGEVFRICVLHTYKWLRARFEGFELPELAYPDPSEAASFDCGSLRSVSLTDPYPIEIIWLPKDRVWCLKLTEPDNGSSETEFRKAREGVAGRFFETNVGYRITDKGVECGFKTVVSEPDGIDEPVESFRLACIKDIARDPGAGLYHGFKLQDKPAAVGTSSDVKKLVRWIRSEERQLPLIISDLGSDKKPAAGGDPLLIAEQFLAARAGSPLDSISFIPSLRPAALPAAAPKKETAERIDAAALARYRMGYAQYFTVSDRMSGLMARELGDEYREGGFTVVEPAAFGGRVRSYDAFSAGSGGRLESFAAGYPAKKPMNFGGVLFTPDARELVSRHVAALAGSREALAQAYEERIRAIEARHEDEIASYRARLDDQIREDLRLERMIESLQEESAKERDSLRKRYEEELARLNAGYEKCLEELERRRALERRPADVRMIADWAEKEFGGRLIMHERAKDLLSGLRPGEWDAGLICDALEFLASDYRDKLMGLISDDAMRENCSRKYGRPFDVAKLNFPSVQAAMKEYKIKYYPDRNGKPSDSLLDLHLRVGNTSEDLLRIYFLFDNEKKLVVVGSLPRHLPTMSYR